MIYTLNPALANKTLLRVVAIVSFALLTGIGAQITIAHYPVPITLQVLMVLMAGISLGARDGFASQITYLGLIAMNLPLAANGVGVAALSGPTAGYLFAFPLAAGLAGILTVRDSMILRWLAGLLAVMVIYVFGAVYLKNYLALSWSATWLAGVKPFILIDITKALLAAAGGEQFRRWWLHYSGLNTPDF